jgi:hypothetical protein
LPYPFVPAVPIIVGMRRCRDTILKTNFRPTN